MFPPLALVKQTPGSPQASTHNSCPFQNRTASNLQSTRRSGTGLRDSSNANWLLVKDHPGGKQRALEILMPLTTLEECPLQKPLLCDSYFFFFFVIVVFFPYFLQNSPTLSHSDAEEGLWVTMHLWWTAYSTGRPTYALSGHKLPPSVSLLSAI